MSIRRLPRTALACVMACAVATALWGCGGTATEPDPTAEEGTQAPGSSSAEPEGGAVSGIPAVADIPEGREIAEGGGGPVQHTFRGAWRAALTEALTWREGAYLITVVADFVNNEGVPSSWTMKFIDSPDTDMVLLLEIDPWGNVTGRREITGEDVSSHVNEYSAPIPVDVIDSDAAVGAGSEALARDYDLADTKDPRMGLGFSDLDGSGPYWTYSVFHSPSATYVSARIDALTGEAQIQ